jgi:CRP/FNR family transcriptional regulator, cyclic AMP receptor protein
MMRHRPDVSAFDGVSMFEGYDERMLAPLARHADRLAVTPGVTLAHEGRRAHEVLVILSGEVVVARGGVEVERLGAGAVIGASEELAGTAHGATVVAGAGVSALAITGPAFRWAVRSLPDFAVPTGAAAG